MFNRLRERIAAARKRALEYARKRNAWRKIIKRRIQQLREAIKRRRERREAVTTMYDSVTVSVIPTNARAVAGYTSGLYPTYPQLVAKFPHAHILSIAIAASVDADCLDIENGDATPSQAPAWVKRQLKRGVVRPVVYSSVSQMPEVLRALAISGIRRSQVRVWTAHYTDVPHLCTSACAKGFLTTADATQFTDHALGRNLDESLLAPGFFG